MMNHKIVKHSRVFLAGALSVALIWGSCSTRKVINPVAKPVDRENLLIRPFGYEPTIRNFEENLPSSYKLQVYTMKNIHRPTVIDTIYRFSKGKSELFIYKNASNREMFFAANIYDSGIPFKNGVKVGMSREEFFRCFTNLGATQKDTIRLPAKAGTNAINFIFRGTKLRAIKIDNYID